MNDEQAVTAVLADHGCPAPADAAAKVLGTLRARRLTTGPQPSGPPAPPPDDIRQWRSMRGCVCRCGHGIGFHDINAKQQRTACGVIEGTGRCPCKTYDPQETA